MRKSIEERFWPHGTARLGELIEDVLGCVDGPLHGIKGHNKFCIFQLNDPKAIRAKLEGKLAYDHKHKTTDSTLS